MSVPQRAPDQPPLHTHTNSLPPLPSTARHVAPLRHGNEPHASVLTSQTTPPHTAEHAHVNAFTASVHVPPLTHGIEAHSSTFVTHVAPEYPAAHAQKKLLC